MYTLELTEDEMLVLHAMAHRTGGPVDGPRQHADAIVEKIDEACHGKWQELDAKRRDTIDVQGSICIKRQNRKACKVYTLDGIKPGTAEFNADGTTARVTTDDGTHSANVNAKTVERKIAADDCIYFC